MNYESICKEIETLTIAYTQQLEEYRQQWEYTGQQFQRGYLNMARAKFAMGMRNITQHSYDKRMKATLQVEINEQGKLNYKQERLTEKILEKKSGNLRRRLTNNKGSQDQSLPLAKKPLRDNPLHWFGLFVSPSLRTSQDHFKLATDRLIQQVNIIKELENIEVQYHKLQAIKASLKLKNHYKQDMVV